MVSPFNDRRRPIYAGNAIATVQSSDPIKVITVRTTGFDAAAAEGGSAAIEKLDAAPDSGISEFESRAFVMCRSRSRTSLADPLRPVEPAHPLRRLSSG